MFMLAGKFLDAVVAQLATVFLYSSLHCTYVGTCTKARWALEKGSLFSWTLYLRFSDGRTLDLLIYITEIA